MAADGQVRFGPNAVLESGRVTVMSTDPQKQVNAGAVWRTEVKGCRCEKRWERGQNTDSREAVIPRAQTRGGGERGPGRALQKQWSLLQHASVLTGVTGREGERQSQERGTITQMKKVLELTKGKGACLSSGEGDLGEEPAQLHMNRRAKREGRHVDHSQNQQNLRPLGTVHTCPASE